MSLFVGRFEPCVEIHWEKVKDSYMKYIYKQILK